MMDEKKIQFAFQCIVTGLGLLVITLASIWEDISAGIAVGGLIFCLAVKVVAGALAAIGDLLRGGR